MKKVFDIYGVLEGYKRRYQTFKNRDDGILKSNKELVLAYLDYKKDLLIRQYGQDETSMIRINKTLLRELAYLINVVYWFNDVNLTDISKQDITRVYQGLETDTLTTSQGKKLKKTSKRNYYIKVFRGGFFKYIGKSKIAKKVVLRKFQNDEEVRYIDYEDFLKIIQVVDKFLHKLYLWLAFDTGVEGGALLQVLKSDFSLEKDIDTGDNYWVLHMRSEISKKSRKKRNIYVYFSDTHNLLDTYLPKLQDNERLFNWTHRNVYKFVRKYSRLTNVKTKPANEPVTLKDMRSSCATYFLLKGWTTDEIKARLGHAPSSRIIDKYVSYFGLNQARKIRQSKELDLSNYKKLYDEMQEELKHIKMENQEIKQDLDVIKLLTKEDWDKKLKNLSKNS